MSICLCSDRKQRRDFHVVTASHHRVGRGFPSISCIYSQYYKAAHSLNNLRVLKSKAFFGILQTFHQHEVHSKVKKKKKSWPLMLLCKSHTTAVVLVIAGIWEKSLVFCEPRFLIYKRESTHRLLARVKCIIDCTGTLV